MVGLRNVTNATVSSHFPMLSQEFREVLEYRLTDALANSREQALQRYWCDGVLEPEWAEEYRPDYVAKRWRIILRAWMEGSRTKTAPLTHQVHPLHLVLGSESLKSYLRGGELLSWIADSIDPTTVLLDATTKLPTFIIHLP
jgi:hypothetical protein